MEFEEFKDVLMHQRAIRVVDDRPVDDATIEQILRIATFAPNGGNRQPVRFLVVRDPETKGRLGEIFADIGKSRDGGAPEATPWRDVPVLIVVLGDPPEGSPTYPGNIEASVYPTVQNVLLTAHAMGLGSVLTTRWMTRQDEFRAILGYPEHVKAYAVLPIGWPTRKYGRGKRRPVAEISYRDKWGQPWLQSIETTVR